MRIVSLREITASLLIASTIFNDDVALHVYDLFPFKFDMMIMNTKLYIFVSLLSDLALFLLNLV